MWYGLVIYDEHVTPWIVVLYYDDVNLINSLDVILEFNSFANQKMVQSYDKSIILRFHAPPCCLDLFFNTVFT